LIDLAIASVLGVGLETGVFHVEAKLTSRGPRLIEINARLGGGPICEMHKRVGGINLAMEQIRMSTGIPPAFIPHTSPAPTEFAYMTTNALSSGTIGPNMEFLERIQNQYPEIINMMCRVKPGDRIVGPEDGQPTWLVEIWLEKKMDDSIHQYDIVERICGISDELAKAFQDNYASRSSS
jgi:hypothetical protein